MKLKMTTVDLVNLGMDNVWRDPVDNRDYKDISWPKQARPNRPVKPKPKIIKRWWDAPSWPDCNEDSADGPDPEGDFMPPEPERPKPVRKKPVKRKRKPKSKEQQPDPSVPGKRKFDFELSVKP